MLWSIKKLKAALQFMITHKGPYFIHCFAGVDRTGFVIALMEAFMGANLKNTC
jgi:protein tyrosine/serine phosphatase